MSTDLLIYADNLAAFGGRRVPCALGRSGIRQDKREGDGATPVGRFPLRRVLYRADRLTGPATQLPVTAIERHDGWCDDPADPAYNRPVRLPYPGRHEIMWRDDSLYDIVVVIGHNDTPPLPGAGSAVFLHLAAADYSPTEGCVALALPDMLAFLKDCDESSVIEIQAAAAP
ncbi:MAG: L,D-transpeptidase family protein [Minwuiales bacterium]|nr:L,D-transpeptidase family protein [Minwuiales bacterium]